MKINFKHLWGYVLMFVWGLVHAGLVLHAYVPGVNLLLFIAITAIIGVLIAVLISRMFNLDIQSLLVFLIALAIVMLWK